MCFLLTTFDNPGFSNYYIWIGITFYDLIFLKFCCLWTLNPWLYVFYIYFLVTKFTVFFGSSLLRGFGSLVFKNLKTLGHLIGSIKFIYPLLSNLSILASIPLRTDVYNNSEAEGLI